MKRALFALALSFFAASAVMAQTPAPIPDTPLPSEVAFVQSVTKDLNARFPNPAAAEKAGYFRFNNEDKTGAISYTNLKWNSVDPRHPSQLWYDVKGRLLGADFERPIAMPDTGPPKIWGINPQRWFRFCRKPCTGHVHWIERNPDGTLKYGLAVSGTAFMNAGGDIQHPQAATLVKMGKVADPSRVVKIFEFPAMWDVELWVVPNPKGAFASTNPLVHPSTENAKGEM
jgi:hypothetical protein